MMTTIIKKELNKQQQNIYNELGWQLSDTQ